MADRAIGHEKIEMVWDSVVSDIHGVEEDAVTGVQLENLKTGASTRLDCAGVFVAIGHVPNTQLFKGQLAMDEAGYILPEKGSRTSPKGSLWQAIARIRSIVRRSPLQVWDAWLPLTLSATSEN